jgi:hypothetical protein
MFLIVFYRGIYDLLLIFVDIVTNDFADRGELGFFAALEAINEL